MPDTNRVTVFIDGSCPANPGPMGIGVYSPGLFEISRAAGAGTNNVAEFLSLEAALDELAARGIQNAVIYSDSMLLVNQIWGKWQVKSETSKSYVARIQAKMNGHDLVWIPRELNTNADLLSAQATGAKR